MTNAILFVVSFLGLASSSYGEWFPVLMESMPYPAVANAAQVSGSVHLKVFLNASGDVERSEVLSGNKLLANAAQRELVRWRFRDPNPGGTKENSTIEFTIDFRLEGTTDGRPQTTFRYEHPYRVTITSEAKVWTP